ncbi:hypothetical protein PFISCL1PPCAC_17552 [Pristionchus fissidentatus]|uniref:Ribosomal protein n=1 Tax=Pristionchus fissidentatus TaxID=1538716 RepID=A0AAV5W372_9BILA|nr:hypothetical protein PFISCL1PPCAC_17552 [Pristionchus fissidentatus]
MGIEADWRVGSGTRRVQQDRDGEGDLRGSEEKGAGERGVQCWGELIFLLYSFPRRSTSGIVLDGEVLSADHAVSLEPLAAELLGGTVGGVGPLDRDTVVVGVLLSVGEGVARDGDEGGLLGVEHSGSGVDAESPHVGGLEGPSDTASGRVGHLDVVGVLVIVGGVEDDLGAGLSSDISGRN